jgi:hypothetical protein
MMPNMAVFAPMAMPNVAMTIVLKPGEYRIARRTYRMSWPSVSSDGTPIAVRRCSSSDVRFPNRRRAVSNASCSLMPA